MTSKIKLELDQSSIDFLNKYERFGFKTNSAMIKEALVRLKNELDLKKLRDNSDLYTTVSIEKPEIEDAFKYLFE